MKYHIINMILNINHIQICGILCLLNINSMQRSSCKGQVKPSNKFTEPSLLCHLLTLLTGMYVRVYVYVCKSVFMYVCMYVRTCVCMYVCTYVCTYVYVCMYVCVCVCVCVYISVCVYTHMCVCIYTYVRACSTFLFPLFPCLFYSVLFLLFHFFSYFYDFHII